MDILLLEPPYRDDAVDLPLTPVPDYPIYFLPVGDRHVLFWSQLNYKDVSFWFCQGITVFREFSITQPRNLCRSWR